jgi:hypothetical protein
MQLPPLMGGRSHTEKKIIVPRAHTHRVQLESIGKASVDLELGA